MPDISIIMPVYNGVRTLKGCIDSILFQTYSDFELIICNDSSTDGTQTVLNNISDKRVRIINNNKNIGPGPSRDRAIEIAMGNWLAFTDADDKWLPDRLEIMLSVIKSSGDLMVFDNILECHDAPAGMIPWRILRDKHSFGGNGIDPVDVSIENFISSKRLLIKPIVPISFIKTKKIRHSIRPYSKEPVEDSEFFMNLLANGIRLRFIPKPMYYYRITPGSASSQTIRSTMMREVLEDAIGKFDHAPIVQAALRKKINIVAREEKYRPFIIELKKKKFYKAFQIACNNTWVISELFKRLWLSLFYHAHRIWHGGSARGIR